MAESIIQVDATVREAYKRIRHLENEIFALRDENADLRMTVQLLEQTLHDAERGISDEQAALNADHKMHGGG